MKSKSRKVRFKKKGGNKRGTHNKSRYQNKSRSKKNKTQKQFKKLNCSPENKHKEYTCYSDSDLTKLKDMWNARHPDQPIKTTDSKQIWKQLKDYYASTCSKESCWVRQMTKNTKMEKE